MNRKRYQPPYEFKSGEMSYLGYRYYVEGNVGYYFGRIIAPRQLTVGSCYLVSHANKAARDQIESLVATSAVRQSNVL